MPHENPTEGGGSTIKEPAHTQGEKLHETQENLNQEFEKAGEEEDVQITGEKEGEPVVELSVRGRLRSAVKKEVKKEEHEQSTGSERGTKRKVVAAKPPRSVKGKSVESPFTVSTDLGARVVLSGCRVEDGYFNVPALSEYKDLIEYQGWMSLFDCSAANVSG